MESCYWTNVQCRAQTLKNLPPVTSRAVGAQHIPCWKFLYWLYILLQVPNSYTGLFHQEEKWFSIVGQHYKTLNAVIVKNWYSLPLISELVSKLQDTWYFTKLDICWEFNNVYIKPEDEWKAVFCTNYSLFKSLMMFFKHN